MVELGTRCTTERVHVGHSPPTVARACALLDPASGLQAFQSFANGLRADYEAVKAGVTLSWSTGPVEGQINRLKMLNARCTVELELIYYGSACCIRHDTHECRVACGSRPSRHHIKWPRTNFGVESMATFGSHPLFVKSRDV